MQIEDRTFIVSGGSRGLGLATAINLAENGANVSILDVNLPPASTSKAFSSSQLLFTKTDVMLTNAIQKAVKNTVKWANDTSKPLSGVICCAGIGGAGLVLPKHHPSATHENLKYYDMTHFDRVLSVNLRGTVDLIRLTLPHIALNQPYGDDDERGVIVMVSSIAAQDGQIGQVAYSASKGAINGLVLPMARELGFKAGIRVMGIAPGVFETGLTVPSKKTSNAIEKQVGKTKTKTKSFSSLFEYPRRMGHGHEFARLVKEIIENPMHNGFVI